MSEGGADDAPVSRHAAGRRTQAVTPSTDAGPSFPGLSFRPEVRSRRKISVNLEDFPRRGLALEAARMIFEDNRNEIAYESTGAVDRMTQTLTRFGEFLVSHDKPSRAAETHRINSFSDLRPEDVDAFDDWLHEHAFPRGSASPYGQINSFVCFLRRALDRNLADPSLRDRLEYISERHLPVASKPLEPYDGVTMANLRRAAREDVTRIVERFEAGRHLLDNAGSAQAEDLTEPAALIRHLRCRGMVSAGEMQRLATAYYCRGRRLLDTIRQVYLLSVDCVPFLILISDATGREIECIRELKAGCLTEFEPPDGRGKLEYVKRRKTRSDEPLQCIVDVAEPFSAGWLITQLRSMTAVARRELGLDETGPLFLGYAHQKIKALSMGHDSGNRWLKRHPEIRDARGEKLKTLQLSRIRKTYKANVEYVGRGGRLGEINDDHTLPVFTRWYGNVRALMDRHEGAIAAGLQEAHDSAMRPRILTRRQAEALQQDPKGAAPSLGLTEEQATRIASGGSDVWTSACLDFYDSPYGDKGLPCGAPVFGCLDCANAVVTDAKLPALVRLRNHIVGKRQEMHLDEWKRNYGFAYVRLRQIIELFPEGDVAAANEEASGDHGREWTVAQIAYRMGTTR